MKKIALLLSLFAITLICSCVGSSEKKLNFNDTYTINADCPGALNKADFDIMSQSIISKDWNTIDAMLLSGDLFNISKGTKVKVLDLGFGWVKVSVNSKELYILRICLD